MSTKFDQDPYPDWLGSLDPDPRKGYKAGSGSRSGNADPQHWCTGSISGFESRFHWVTGIRNLNPDPTKI